MNIGEDFAKAFGGEVVQAQEDDNNTVDLSSAQEAVDGGTVETPQESSLNNEEASVETPQHTEQSESTVSEADVYSYLSEKLGRDITSLESLNDNSTDTPDNPFVSERLKVINDYIKDTGRTVEDYISTQTVDLSNLSDDVIMKEYLRMENPDLTEAELKDYMDATYKLDENEYNEREGNVGKVQLKKDSRAAREYFGKIKTDYATPLEGHNEADTSEEDKAEWVTSMESNVNDMEALAFTMNEKGDEFTFALDEDARSEIKGYNNNLEGFFDKYVSEDGNWDFDSLNKDMYILNNIDKIVKSVAGQYKSKGTEDVINQIKNPSYESDKQGDSPQKQKDVMGMLRDEIFGGPNRGL